MFVRRIYDKFFLSNFPFSRFGIFNFGYFSDSAPAGPGPDMERVLFNLSGRSPLVAHYLYMKNLRQKETVGKLIKRTEVVREPYPFCWFSRQCHSFLLYRRIFALFFVANISKFFFLYNPSCLSKWRR